MPQVQALSWRRQWSTAVLIDAARLTVRLEQAGAAAPLRALNLAGCQRMLPQRYAKVALLGALGHPALAQRSAVGMASTCADFAEAVHELNNLPLSSPDIRRALADAKLQWQHMLVGADDAVLPAGHAMLVHASKALLAAFEQLTEHHEDSLQILTCCAAARASTGWRWIPPKPGVEITRIGAWRWSWTLAFLLWPAVADNGINALYPVSDQPHSFLMWPLVFITAPLSAQKMPKAQYLMA